MSDSAFIALLATLPPTLTALAALIVGVVNSVKSNKIHVLVNSNMTAVKTDLAAAKTEISDLHMLIAKLTTAQPPSAEA